MSFSSLLSFEKNNTALLYGAQVKERLFLPHPTPSSWCAKIWELLEASWSHLSCSTLASHALFGICTGTMLEKQGKRPRQHPWKVSRELSIRSVPEATNTAWNKSLVPGETYQSCCYVPCDHTSAWMKEPVLPDKQPEFGEKGFRWNLKQLSNSLLSCLDREMSPVWDTHRRLEWFSEQFNPWSRLHPPVMANSKMVYRAGHSWAITKYWWEYQFHEPYHVEPSADGLILII